jgi:thiol-disulfide isomerase/thioredoxin
MKLIKQISILLILAVVAVSCSSETEEKTDGQNTGSEGTVSKSGIPVKGAVTNGAGKTIHIEAFVKGQIVKVDSAVVAQDGTFEVHVQNENLDFYRLGFYPQNFISIFVEKGNETNITGDADNFIKTYTVTGGSHSQLLNSYVQENFKYNDEIEALRTQMKALEFHDSLNRKELIAKISVLKEEVSTFRYNFTETNYTSPVALMALNDIVSMKGQPNIDSTDLVYFEKVKLGMEKAMPNTIYHESVSRQLIQLQSVIAQNKYQQEEIKRVANLLKRGTPAPEISMNTPNNTSLPLSSLRGKIVLVDFWASWCRPCRAENPNVVRLYNKYKSKGFEIYSVSLDKSKERWVQAIQQDGLIWPSHVSDLAQWSSSVVPQYGIKGIPFTVLLDKDGNVIETGLRGPLLEAKLKQLFGS